MACDCVRSHINSDGHSRASGLGGETLPHMKSSLYINNEMGENVQNNKYHLNR